MKMQSSMGLLFLGLSILMTFVGFHLLSPGETLDAKLYYTPLEAQILLASLSERQIHLYISTEF
ncbi:MAG: hypothetical protein GW917_00645, partial [Bdellovibrionales bacterium]|nr:hypothetical protein [Bdellovibrionales bacterium]